MTGDRNRTEEAEAAATLPVGFAWLDPDGSEPTASVSSVLFLSPVMVPPYKKKPVAGSDRLLFI